MASVEQNQQTDLEKFVNQNNPPTEGDLSGFSALNSRNSGNFSFANSGTSKAIQNDGFSVGIQDTVPATVLNDGTTIADVFDERDRLEARQGQKPFDLDAIGKFTEPTPFNNPQAFVEDMLFGEQEPSQTAQDIAGLRGDVTDTISGISDELTTAETRARKETGIGTLSQDLAKTNEAIARRQARFRRESREFLSDAQERGVAREFVTRQQQKMKADATAELADLYIVQNAQSGNVEAARDFIDTAVDNRYRNIEIELNEKRAQIEELLPTLEAEEKLKVQQLAIALEERQNNLESEKEDAKTKRELAINAAKNGASQTVIRSITNASSVDDALASASPYIGLLERQEAARAAANTALTRRKNLMELALMGDKSAKDELLRSGVDVDAMLEEQETEALLANDQLYTDAKLEYDSLAADLTNNQRGLEAASGLVRSPFASSLTGGGFYEQIRRDKLRFLASSNRLIETFALKNLVDLKAEGATFGALTEKEFAAIKNAATPLSGLAKTNDAGKITGFTDEALAQRYINEALYELELAMDRLNDDVLSVEDKNEIVRE